MSSGLAAFVCAMWFFRVVASIIFIVGGALYKSHPKVGFLLLLIGLLLALSSLCLAALETAHNPTALGRCCIFSCVILGFTIYVICCLVAAYRNQNMANFKGASATLTQFNLTNNFTTLNYSLSLNVAVDPSYRKLASGVCFAKLEACGYYQGHNFTCLSNFPPFYLGDNANSIAVNVLQPMVFLGQQELVLTGAGLNRYRRHAGAGRFSIVVTMSYLGFKAKIDEYCNPSAVINGTLMSNEAHILKGVATLELKDVPLAQLPVLYTSSGGKAVSVSKALHTSGVAAD